MKVDEFWRILEQLDDQNKKESGEMKKYKIIEDPRYEAK